MSFAGFPLSITSFFPDNGLASLAGVLLASGHEVKILDYNTVHTLERIISPERSQVLRTLHTKARGSDDPEARAQLGEVEALVEADFLRVTDAIAEDIAAQASEMRAHFVGFKLWSGDGFRASVRIAGHLRRVLPAVKLFAGGPTVLYSGEAIFRFTTAFDALVDGEGEAAIVGLAAHIEGKTALQDIPNLIVRDGDGAIRRTAHSFVPDLTTLPLPCYAPEVYPSLSAGGQAKMFILDESRGCPMSCSFCIHPTASGNRWRVKPVDRIMEEIEQFQALHQSNVFRFGGSYTPPSFYKTFSQAVNSANRAVRFCGFASPMGMRRAHFDELYEAGCRSLFFGVESFDAADLERIGKKMDPLAIEETLLASLHAGIHTVVSLIVPLPGQGEEAIAHNKAVMRRLAQEGSCSLSAQVAGLIPRSAWWNERARYGFELQVSEEAYAELVATYAVRYFIPLTQWPSVPYSLDGKRFEELCRVSAALHGEMAREGLAINATDELGLLSSTMKRGIAELKRELDDALLNMDAAKLRQAVADVNQAVRYPP